MVIIESSMAGTHGDMVAIDQRVLLIKLIRSHSLLGNPIGMFRALTRGQPLQIHIARSCNAQRLVDGGQ
ncbi:hypothetical protein D3C87_2040900 [compost metagenome]